MLKGLALGGKLQKICDALVDGAEQGLVREALFQHIVAKVPKATSAKIVKASLFALSDPDVKDRNILGVIYDLAIAHRLDPQSSDDLNDFNEVPKSKNSDRARRNSGLERTTL